MISFSRWLEMALHDQGELEKMGYKFKVENELPMELHIKCFYKNELIGQALFTQDEGWVRLDNLSWNDVWDDEQDAIKPNQMWVMSVNVNSEHQRKGIASAMYSYAEKLTGNRIIRTTSHTPDSDAMWSQKNRPFST